MALITTLRGVILIIVFKVVFGEELLLDAIILMMTEWGWGWGWGGAQRYVYVSTCIFKGV